MSEQTPKDPSGGPHITSSGDNARIAGRDFHETHNYGAGDPRQALLTLLEDLKQAAAREPQAAPLLMKAEDAVKDATRETPDAKRVQIRVEDLKQAAENIKTVLPTVFQIATSLIASIVALRGS